MDAYLDTDENIQRLKLMLSSKFKFPHHKSVTSKKPFAEMHENWEMDNVPIPVNINTQYNSETIPFPFPIRWLIYWWIIWAFRVTTWNLKVEAAKNVKSAEIPILLSGNIQVLFFLYLGMTSGSIIIFVGEMGKLMIGSIGLLCFTLSQIFKTIGTKMEAFRSQSLANCCKRFTSKLGKREYPVTTSTTQVKMIEDRAISWSPITYPQVQCQEGYDTATSGGSGEGLLQALAKNICPESTVGCYKRCVYEYLGVLQETSILLPDDENYNKVLLEKEDWIGENLDFMLFSKEDVAVGTGMKVAKRIVAECSAILEKLNGMKSAPTCLQQNELYLCMEQAMNCPDVEQEKGTLITKVCSIEIHDFHYSAAQEDSKPRMYNETYPDVTCHKTFDPVTAKAISILSRFCSRSLRGCYKRCMLERLGVLEYIMQPKHNFYSIAFRKEAEMAESIQFYLFRKASADTGLNVAQQIIKECDELAQIFKDMTTPALCNTEENELYLCIEKALVGA
ncbi:unnamed protein product [Orchesella dallaii]|uniref:Uncharacterized protein n=1 Tax=Orchesella dallaii TaxID=48710 RepID=A0ABP1RQ42_9HEXA